MGIQFVDFLLFAHIVKFEKTLEHIFNKAIAIISILAMGSNNLFATEIMNMDSKQEVQFVMYMHYKD